MVAKSSSPARIDENTAALEVALDELRPGGARDPLSRRRLRPHRLTSYLGRRMSLDLSPNAARPGQ